MTIQEAKQQIVHFSKRLYTSGMVSVYEGNISMRVGDRFVITPSRTDKFTLSEDMLIEFDADGNILNPNNGKKISSEWKMHAEAYRVRPDLDAIVHCHSPYATAYAMAHKPIIPLGNTEAIAIFKEIPMAPYGRPGTPDIAKGFKELLPKYPAVLLENHGVLTIAADLAEAYSMAEGVEKIARMELLASLLGGEKKLADEEIAFLKAL